MGCRYFYVCGKEIIKAKIFSRVSGHLLQGSHKIRQLLLLRKTKIRIKILLKPIRL
jgi:hypothetical protein